MRPVLASIALSIGFTAAALAAPLDPPLDCAGFRDAEARDTCARANDGELDSLWQVGEHFLQSRRVAPDDVAAFRVLSIAAEAGNARAQALLGFMYGAGRHVAADPALSLRLARQAAAQGDALGQANLGGVMWCGCDGVARDEAGAVRLFRLSAAQGHRWGQFKLARAYETGRGAPFKPLEAMRLYRLAAEQGEKSAQVNLARLLSCGCFDIPIDRTEALRLYTLAAEQGETLAYLGLGNIYTYGLGAPKNTLQGELWYRKAMDAGSVEAMSRIAWFYAQSEPAIALRYAEGAVMREPYVAEYQAVLAFVLLRKGEPERALPYAETALRRDPTNPTYYDRLGDILAAMGRYDTARRAWQAAVELIDRPRGATIGEPQRLRQEIAAKLTQKPS